MKLDLQHHLKGGQKMKPIENNNWYYSTSEKFLNINLTVRIKN